MILTTNNIEYHPKKLEIMQTLCRASKDLYNFGLYQIRQHFFKTKEYLSYSKNYHIVKNLEDNLGESPYYKLPTNASQQTLKAVDSGFKSFFSLLKKKANGKYDKDVKIPNYLDKEGNYKVVFTKIHIRFNGDYALLTLPKYLKEEYKISSLNFKIPKHIKKESIKEIHILPKGKRFELSWIREKEEVKSLGLRDNLMSIDLGVNNFASVLTLNEKPLLFSGLKAKSINSHFNNKISSLQSQIDLAKNHKSDYSQLSTKVSKLFFIRNNYIKDFTLKTAQKIVDTALTRGVSTIIIGFNKEWKNEVNMGRKNNKTFYGLPHSKLIDYIKYKAQLVGIKVEIQEESYTSKCDSLAKELPQKHSKYLGRRVKRGLFQSSIGKLINADINGCINILVKYLNSNKQDSSSVVDRILSKGFVFNPLRVQVF